MAVEQGWGGGHLEWVVASACGLSAADNGVQRVHVVCGERPTYDELSRYRRHAAVRGRELSVDGQGVVLVRPAKTASPWEGRE